MDKARKLLTPIPANSQLNGHRPPGPAVEETDNINPYVTLHLPADSTGKEARQAKTGPGTGGLGGSKMPADPNSLYYDLDVPENATDVTVMIVYTDIIYSTDGCVPPSGEMPSAQATCLL